MDRRKVKMKAYVSMIAYVTLNKHGHIDSVDEVDEVIDVLSDEEIIDVIL